MKRILSTIVCVALAMASWAQETYQSATITDADLNGTARYVGMGGAMEALGADISTMSTNPAGVAVMRSTSASATMGIVNQAGENSFGGSKTNVSFDQIGVVFSIGSGLRSRLNFGFNYHKEKNFNQLMDVTDKLSLASQNKLSCIKYADGIMNDDNYSQVDFLYNTGLNGIVNKKGEIVRDFVDMYNSSGYNLQRIQSGYMSAYDMNISGSYDEQFYWGLTVGLKDLHYNNRTIYTESLLAGDDRTNLGDVQLEDSRDIRGTGVDIKLGFIVRPFREQPFRIGGYIHTPTWYNLRTSNFTVMYFDVPDLYRNYSRCDNDEAMDFKLNSPWHFGLSLGHTFGGVVALGATYDYANHSSIDNRVIDGYNYYGNKHSKSDIKMNKNTSATLNGVHTVKVGAEIRPLPIFALRLGYNYLSPKFKKDAYRDVTIESPGVYMSSTTDYTNWQETHRVTAGLGFTFGNATLDLAYQYNCTNGEFNPFLSYYSSDEFNNVCDAVSVSDKRHQVMLTFGYKF